MFTFTLVALRFSADKFKLVGLGLPRRGVFNVCINKSLHIIMIIIILTTGCSVAGLGHAI